MPRALKSCLLVASLVAVFVMLCMAVWVVGTVIFGLPTIRDTVGPPAPGLGQAQEAALSLYLLVNQRRLDEGAGNPDIVWTVEIEPGATAQSVIDQLTTIGLLHDPLLFRTYIRYLGYDRGIESGFYDLSGAMTIRELAAVLQSARSESLTLTIPEGWRAEQVAERIRDFGVPFAPSEFLQAVQSPTNDLIFSFSIPDNSSLEGLLFPDTYVLEPDVSAQELVQLMVSNFDQRVDDSMRQAINDQGLSLYEGIILAAIVEREAIVAEERPRIAAVFLNRIALGMKLDADPTVQYAIAPDQHGAWWPTLTLGDLQFDSPYNTYRYPGLPPGPIASPGLDSLKAVAYPLTTSEYYFRALCDGSGKHVFAETFEQHQLNACQ